MWIIIVSRCNAYTVSDRPNIEIGYSNPLPGIQSMSENSVSCFLIPVDSTMDRSPVQGVQPINIIFTDPEIILNRDNQKGLIRGSLKKLDSLYFYV